MVQTIITIAAVISSLLVIGGIILGFYKIIKRFEGLEESTKCRKEESGILLKSTVAILDGLIQMNCNGPVTLAKNELQEYLFKRGD
jgi:hypothetical protein